MEGAKSLEVRPRGTSRRMGRGTFGRWRRELGRPSPARRSASAAVGASRPITGAEPGSGWRAGWASEAAVVPLEPAGQQNPGRWEGPLLRSRVTYGEGLVSAIVATTTKQDRVRELQRALYRAAKADPHGGSRMPAVKNVGEPCAGEPHARFEVAAGGNLASRHCRAALAPPADPTSHWRRGG